MSVRHYTVRSCECHGGLCCVAPMYTVDSYQLPSPTSLNLKPDILLTYMRKTVHTQFGHRQQLWEWERCAAIPDLCGPWCGDSLKPRYPQVGVGSDTPPPPPSLEGWSGMGSDNPLFRGLEWDLASGKTIHCNLITVRGYHSLLLAVSTWTVKHLFVYPQMSHSENNILISVLSLLTHCERQNNFKKVILFWKGATRYLSVASSHACSSNISRPQSTRDRTAWWCSAECGSACHLSPARWFSDLLLLPSLLFTADRLVTVADKTSTCWVNKPVKYIIIWSYPECKSYIQLVLHSHWDSKLNSVWYKLFHTSCKVCVNYYLSTWKDVLSL